jgi:hypothetical protein
MELDIQSFRHLPGRELVIGGPDRNRATEEEGIMNL